MKNYSNEEYREALDIELIKKLQRKFSTVARVSICCIDREGKVITEMSGNSRDVEHIRKLVTKEQFLNVVERVNGFSIEEQTVEDSDVPELKLAAVSVRYQGKLFVTWFVCAVLEEVVSKGNAACTEKEEDTAEYKWEATVPEKNLYMVLDLLRDTSQGILGKRMQLEDVKAEERRYRLSLPDAGELLRQNEALTGVIQLLKSEDTIESIMGRMIATVGRYLDATSIQILRLNEKKDRMDVVTEWCNTGIFSNFERTKNLKAYSFLRIDKPLVLSYNSKLDAEWKDELLRLHIRALMCFPVATSGADDLFLCIQERRTGRRWEIEEIKFVSDALQILQSVVTRRKQKNSLADAYKSLVAILDNIGSGVFVKDVKENQILFVNRDLRNAFGEDIMTREFEEFLQSDNAEARYKKTGNWYDISYHQIRWVDGNTVDLYSVYDITEKKQYQRKIEQQAFTDYLTGLYNRMCCERDLACFMDEADKHDIAGTLLYIDLDDFKHINDGLGHQYGDALLKAISARVSRIDGIQENCYRVGGDEFVIIIPPDRQQQQERIVEEIQDVFATPWFLKDTDYYCTMSMGVVEYPKDGESVQELIQKADIAMYEAKRSGKNTTAYYRDYMSAASNRRLDMEKNMRDAIINNIDEFEVHFQPIVNNRIPGRPCIGAEALVRWNSRIMGNLAPSEFVPLAEYLGLISQIGKHTLYEACKACKRWNDLGHEDYKVNVNLSVVQLRQADIVEVIAGAIEKTGINPARLTLEVTESLAINDMKRMQEILLRIKKLGVVLALDDFGTGYSSLNHIREIPIDIIKVDQSFVADLTEDAYSQAFIRMVAELAETLNMTVCVEGIESRKQLDILENMKVLMLQGYFFDKPLKAADFEAKYVL